MYLLKAFVILLCILDLRDFPLGVKEHVCWSKAVRRVIPYPPPAHPHHHLLPQACLITYKELKYFLPCIIVSSKVM